MPRSKPIGPHAHQVAGDAVHLGDDHAQVLGLLGAAPGFISFSTVSAQPRFMFIAGQIVHPVGVGNPLPRREILADLFGTAMQIADVRRAFRNDLAVGPQHQPQHAVRAGMLRAHVDQHLVGANVEFDDPRIVEMRGHDDFVAYRFCRRECGASCRA